MALRPNCDRMVHSHVLIQLIKLQHSKAVLAISTRVFALAVLAVDVDEVRWLCE